jgi:hypothetical protein
MSGASVARADHVRDPREAPVGLAERASARERVDDDRVARGPLAQLD